MKKLNKNIILVSIVLIISIISLSSVYATDHKNMTCTGDNNVDVKSIDTQNTPDVDFKSVKNTATNIDFENNNNNDVKNLRSTITSSTKKDTNNDDNKYKDNSDANELDKTYYVNSSNFNQYFDETNKLKQEYTDSNFVFSSDFNGLGTIKVYNDNTRIIGFNSSFYNTVFDLGANNIILANINMVLDKEFSDNKYAAILSHGENITIYNCTINYDAPEDVTAFGIYSAGHGYDYSDLKIINNTINLKGHALNDNYNYGILLRNTYDSIIYNNNLYCELPIKYILWNAVGSYGDVSKDSVAVIAADYCENLTLSHNYIHSYVNSGHTQYPTLDTVILKGCSYSIIEDNTIISEDYYTKEGQDNYLQALDIYSLNDVTIIDNVISVFTTGGKPGMSTAYPIQVNGPVDHVKIAFNNLTTFNHGPNCGIYSNNYGGATLIDIISNYINVTGDATVDGPYKSWCLVSGIEVQDNGDNILNNTIIVTNLGDYKSNNYVYGVSYAQNIAGKHTYNIQYNNITTNGNYGVKILGDIQDSTTYNSTITNNVINTMTTSKKKGASTNGQVEGPGGTIIRNNTNGAFKNTMSEEYYPDWLKKHKSVTPNDPQIATIPKIISNIKTTPTKSPDNQLNIKPTYTNDNSTGSGLNENKGTGNMPWNTPGNSNGMKNNNPQNNNDISANGTNKNTKNMFNNPSNNTKGLIKTNSSSSKINPGKSNEDNANMAQASPSDTGSSASNSKSYEVQPKTKEILKQENIIPITIACIILLALIIIGYKRKNNTEEE